MYIEKLRGRQNFLSIDPGNEEKIRQIEDYFGYPLPPSFKQYLKEIGYGGIPGFDIIGTGATKNKAAFVFTNEKYRATEENLPRYYFVIMDIGDELIWCLDTSSCREGGECKVTGWISGLPLERQPHWIKERETYDSFREFFQAKIIGNKLR